MANIGSYVHIVELSRHQPYNLGMLFSFDGAARGNPGPAASGACAWWGVFSNATFTPKGLVLQRGSRLGHATNNIAEAHGMATALRTRKSWVLSILSFSRKFAACRTRHAFLESVALGSSYKRTQVGEADRMYLISSAERLRARSDA